MAIGDGELMWGNAKFPVGYGSVEVGDCEGAKRCLFRGCAVVDTISLSLFHSSSDGKCSILIWGDVGLLIASTRRTIKSADNQQNCTTDRLLLTTSYREQVGSG